MTTWHESDELWEILGPIMFDEQRMAATPLEVELVTARLNLDPPAAILDMGCGPGRHALELARQGFQVTGVDRTAAYLETARRHAEEENLDVEFVQADMRNFVREGTYHAVLSMYTTFGFFEDPAENLQVLRNVYRSLKPDGELIMELMGKEVLARIFQKCSWQETNGILFLQERNIAKDWSWIDNRWILIRGQDRYEFEISHWVYSAVELSAMLREAGFHSVECYGDLEGAAYDPNAKRLIVVAHK